MNSLEISNILTSDKFVSPIYGGTLASDELPSAIEQYPCCFCVNTAPKHDIGEHWIALFLPRKDCLEVFCSMGTGPKIHAISRHFKLFYKRFGSKRISSNKRCLQDILSSCCGLYTIAYLQTKCRGYPLKTFISCFSLNSKLNDEILRKVYKVKRIDVTNS